jgi:hypothetical protein
MLGAGASALIKRIVSDGKRPQVKYLVIDYAEVVRKSKTIYRKIL